MKLKRLWPVAPAATCSASSFLNDWERFEFEYHHSLFLREKIKLRRLNEFAADPEYVLDFTVLLVTCYLP